MTMRTDLTVLSASGIGDAAAMTSFPVSDSLGSPYDTGETHGSRELMVDVIDASSVHAMVRVNSFQVRAPLAKKANNVCPTASNFSS